MSQIRIYIAEDEPLAAKKLERFVTQILFNANIQIFTDGLKVLEAIEKEEPDILFLDIEMPCLRGIDLLARLSINRHMEVIITTAYEQYALYGFEYSVTDYLLKPYSFDRLSQAVRKAEERLRFKSIEMSTSTNDETLSVRTELHTEIIKYTDIICLESLKDYVRIVCCNRRLLTLDTLSNFEASLPSSSFVRIHRSTIINLLHITSFGRDSVSLSNGISYNIGKKYKESFENSIKKRY